MKKTNRLNVYLFVVLFNVVALSASSQDLGKEWFKGRLYLTNGEKMEGLLQYKLDKGYLIIKKANRVKAFNVQQIEYFDFLDHIQKRIRSFYSIVHRAKNKKQHMFFELLKQGELSLLAREAWFVNNRPFARGWQFSHQRFSGDLELKEEYYILDRKQNLIQFTGVKNQLLELMQDNYQEIDTYIKSERLQMERRADLLKIFYFYDNLKELQAKEEGNNQS